MSAVKSKRRLVLHPIQEYDLLRSTYFCGRLPAQDLDIASATGP